MREDQHGRYYGVGMTIQQSFNGGKTYVVYPFEGTPSFRAGIHPGDVIAAVDGKSTDGMTSDLVAKALKGTRAPTSSDHDSRGPAEATRLRPGAR